nr:hypothetical protein CFP56_30152 [Quercus suber]
MAKSKGRVTEMTPHSRVVVMCKFSDAVCKERINGRPARLHGFVGRATARLAIAWCGISRHALHIQLVYLPYAYIDYTVHITCCNSEPRFRRRTRLQSICSSKGEVRQIAWIRPVRSGSTSEAATYVTFAEILGALLIGFKVWETTCC